MERHVLRRRTLSRNLGQAQRAKHNKMVFIRLKQEVVRRVINLISPLTTAEREGGWRTTVWSWVGIPALIKYNEQPADIEMAIRALVDDKVLAQNAKKQVTLA